MQAESQRREDDSAVRRYEELSTGYARYTSEPGELNREFVDPLETFREKFGGGACRRADHEPIQGAVALTLVGIGDSDRTARSVSLEEGDAATIPAGDRRFRIKLYGQRRPAERVGRGDRVVAFGVDVWTGDRWREIDGHVETTGVAERSHGDGAVRVIVPDAPRIDEPTTLRGLLERGLSPAEAVDYLLVELGGRDTADWADCRDVPREEITANVRRARERLDGG